LKIRRDQLPFSPKLQEFLLFIEQTKNERHKREEILLIWADFFVQKSIFQRKSIYFDDFLTNPVDLQELR